MPFKYNPFTDEMDYYADTLPTIKLTNLTDGYVPYHVSDAAGLADSPIFIGPVTGGIGVGIGGSPSRRFQVTYSWPVNITTMAYYNPDTTDGAGTVVSFRTDTTGVGAASFVEVAGFYASYKVHDHATRSSDFVFFTSTGAVLQNLIWKGNGNLGVRTLLPVAPLEVEDNATTASMLVKITQDNQDVFGLVIGNDAYSTTDTNGLAFKVLDTGAPTISWTAGTLTLDGNTYVDGDLEVNGAIKYVWKVGAYYFNSTGVNPATELGYGTWTQVGQGQFLVGAS